MTIPTCSIVINTCDRASHLRRLLPGLMRLTGVAYEIVVVNGPSTDETEEVLEAYAPSIKIARCRERNLSMSRNVGIAKASGDIVAFLDDDALPIDESWLLRFAEAFARDPEGRIGAVGGGVYNGDLDTYEFNGGLSSEYGFQVFDAAADSSAVQQKGQFWIQRVPGGNCAYRREVLVSLGGFDEFISYYNDETDLCMRMVRAGYGVKFLPDNPIRHYPVRAAMNARQLAVKRRVVAKSDTYFAMKNASDALWVRLFKTLWKAPQKHYFKEIKQFRQEGFATRAEYFLLVKEWCLGVVAGAWAGLVRPRRIVSLPSAPGDFLAVDVSQTRGLRIALLSKTVPGQAAYGGIGRYTYDLARGLHERGHEVHIICDDARPIRRESLGFYIHGISDSDRDRQRIFKDYPVLNKNMAHSLAVNRKLATLYMSGLEFDVVHATNWDAEAAAVIKADVYPVVLMLVTSLAQDIVEQKWTLDEDLSRCLAVDEWQIREAHAVCAPSAGVLESYRHLTGLPDDVIDRVTITPLGIVPDICETKEPKDSQKRLLYVGRCERRKGIHTLLAVLPELLKNFSEWECHIVGNDQILDEDGMTFRDKFIRLHVSADWLTRVTFHGLVDEDELKEQYQDCDLFVAPSLFESFGLIYHEAMQYGKAVIGCRTGGVPEVVADGKDGVLVKPDNPDELQKALASLMGDDVLRSKMGYAGREKIRTRMNYRTMAQNLEKVYESVIAAAGPRCAIERRSYWPVSLPLFAPSESVEKKGRWERRCVENLGCYLYGAAGASIEFAAKPGTSIHLSGLCHSWCGILEVRADDDVIKYINFYQPVEAPQKYESKIVLPVAQSSDVWVTMRVHGEHDPRGFGNEIWLDSISAVRV